VVPSLITLFNKMAETILGISLGTRIIGFAVMRNGELVDYRIKCFKDRWTRTKRDSIVSYIEKLIDYYSVTAVAIKALAPIRSSARLNALTENVKKELGNHNARVFAYSMVTVKLALGIPHSNQRDLMEFIAERYGLRRLYLKEINNRHDYYDRMFEAIALAKWCVLENEW